MGSVDVDRRDVHFTLVKNDGTTLQCVGEFTATAQITAALAQMLSSLRTRVNKKPATVPVAATSIQWALVQKDPWSDFVLLQLISPEGIPFSFQIQRKDAAALAARLRTESEKPTLTGNA